MLAADGHGVAVALDVPLVTKVIALGILLPAQSHEVFLRIGRRSFRDSISERGESDLRCSKCCVQSTPRSARGATRPLSRGRVRRFVGGLCMRVSLRSHPEGEPADSARQLAGPSVGTFFFV